MTARKVSPKPAKRKAANDSARTAKALLAALDEGATRAARLEAAAQGAACALNADCALVALPPEHPRGGLVGAAGLEPPDARALADAAQATLLASPVFAVDALPAGTALRTLAARLGFTHGACVPFDDGMGAAGVVAALRTGAAAFDEADAELLDRIARQVGAALNTAAASLPPGAKQAGPLVARAFAVLDAFHDPVFRVRKDGTVLDFWATRFTESIAETTRIIGRNIFDVLSPESAEAVRVCVEAALATGRLHTVEYAHALRGRLRMFEARVVACGESEVVALVRDATRGRRRIAEREALARLSQGLTGATGARGVARVLAAACRALFSHDAFSLVQFGREGLGVRGILCEDTPPEAAMPQEVAAPDLSNLSEAELALFTPGSQLINRWEEPETSALLPFGFTGRRARSLLCVTVADGAGLVFRCTVQSYTPGRYSDADLRALRRMVEATLPAFLRTIAVDELRCVEERFRLVAQCTSDVIIEWDPATALISYIGGDEAAVRAKLGLLPRDYAAWEARIHPEDRDAVTAAFKRNMAADEPYDIEYRILADDGEWRIWEVQGTPMCDERGAVRGWVGAITDVTARRHAETELQDKRGKLDEVQKQRRAILHSSPNGLCLLDPGWNILLANRAMHMLLNPLDATNRTFAKMPFSAFFPSEDDYGGFRRAATLALRQAGIYRAEHRMKRLEGDFIWIELAIARVDPGETAAGMVATLTDISERKRAEEALEVSEFIQRSLVEQPVVGVCVVQDDRFAYVNGKFAEMLGFTRAELAELPSIYGIVAPGDQDAVQERVRRRLSGAETTVRYEAHLLRRDGQTVEVDVSGTRIEYLGRPALMAVVLDITEQRRAAHEREALSQMLLRLSGADTVEKVANIVYETCLDLFAMESFRFSVREPNNEEFRSIILMDTLDGTRQFFPPEVFSDPDRAILGRLWAGEPTLLNRTPDNPTPDRGDFGDLARASESFIQAPLTVDGELLGLLAAHSYTRNRFDEHDLGLIERIADAIGPSLERCRAVREYSRVVAAIEQSTDGIIITDPEWRTVYVNPTLVRMTGYSPGEMLGRHPRELLKPRDENADQQLQIAETLARGESWTGEWKCRRKDGSEFDERVTLSPVHDASGSVVNYLAVRRDISHEIAAEAEMRQSQKMEAAGMLAGGVAHDFNNILQIIMGYAQILIRRLAPDDPIRGDLEAINRATRRGAGLARQLLAFSRKQLLQPRHLNLNPIVSDMQRMLRRLIGEDIELVACLAPDLHPVLADPGQVEQVLLNLAVNARDAMPDGGRLYMETKNTAVPSPVPMNLSDLTPGDYACIVVADTGHGMSHDTARRVFEPFFTTKEAGKGTGLGLSTVYGIVRQSGGAVLVDTSPGGGATFTIYLPRAEAPPPDTQSDRYGGSAAVGSETILLVEDEEEVRQLVATMLEGLGYTILQARTGIDGLRVAENSMGPLHLVLTDVVMPEMNGPHMVRQILVSHPEARVIYMSGYTDSGAVRQVLSEPDSVLLQKPVSPGVLARRIREALDKKGNV